MDAPGADQSDESIGALVGRLIEDGRNYAEAELDLLKAIARYRAIRAGKALAGLAAAVFLGLAALAALVTGAVLALAPLIGAFWAGVAVAAPLLLGAILLGRYGAAGLKDLGQDEAEREAIRRGARE